MGDKYIIKKGFSKYPTFHYNELEKIIKEKEFTKDTTINSLKKLKENIEILTNDLNNIINSNLNNFNVQSKLYNRNSNTYLFLSKIDLKLCELMLYKLSNDNEDNNYIFDKNDIISNIKSQFKKKDELFSFLKRIHHLLDKLELIYISNHTCAITYLNIIFNYIDCYIKEILSQMNIFKTMIINHKDNKYNYNMDNEIILIDLIFMLEKLDSICYFLSSGYFVDPNDILNQKEDTEDWENINRIGLDIIFKRENEIQKVFKQQSLNTEKLIAALLNSYDESGKFVFRAFRNIKWIYFFV